MVYESLSKMCMYLSIVGSLIIALIGSLMSLKVYEAHDKRMSHVFDKECFDFSMEQGMRPCSTLSEFHESFVLEEESVDFGQ